MSLKDLPWVKAITAVRDAVAARGDQMFLEWPYAWFADWTVRCENGHVSTCVLAEERGSLCLACHTPVWLTYPGDDDGPFDAAKALAWKR